MVDARSAKRSSGLAMILMGCLIGAAATGCAHRVWNAEIEDPDPSERYEFRNRLPENAEELFIVLAFSGGGTRAAAFSYGVLEALRETEVTLRGTKRRLLDEVDGGRVRESGAAPGCAPSQRVDRVAPRPVDQTKNGAARGSGRKRQRRGIVQSP